MSNTKLTPAEYTVLKEVYPPFSPHDYNENVMAVYLAHDWLLNQWLVVNSGHVEKIACLIGDDLRFREFGYDDDQISRFTASTMKHAG
ncbi:MAG: hypothetical protein R3321_00100 [Nitrososphaeraceae archaeon]|nr:hypothetical protein [Nitrososphaeraceae archaeon]